MEQLHFALALVCRNLMALVRQHARHSKNSDLFCEAINHTIGDGHEAANLIEHYAKVCPDEFKTEDCAVEPESWPDQFAWDAYL